MLYLSVSRSDFVIILHILIMYMMMIGLVGRLVLMQITVPLFVNKLLYLYTDWTKKNAVIFVVVVGVLYL